VDKGGPPMTETEGWFIVVELAVIALASLAYVLRR
jgi:hypothetical protein